MTRRRPLLTVVLALLLVLQWGGAFAHCLAALAGSEGVVICSAEGGIRTLHLDAEGQPAAPAAAAHDSCPVCPGGAAPAPPVPALPALRIAYAPPPAPPIAGMPPAPACAPPQQPRAPPAA
ncbi:hypothetical protein JMJ55_00625 [Belnapia sp. T6]|uniref:DUF2946 domain-containing protein n=1 Tax=Belnapia mucosa TaxID=2804532 RepID=A0ABS1V0J5_9PROT|nr:DUF2946 family protein [Belnapia mucosa]MBL6453803.1 hypothetical protein [Belnapia mucosa]